MAIWPVATILDNEALDVYVIVFPKQAAILTPFPQGAQVDCLQWLKGTAQYHPGLLRSPRAQSCSEESTVWMGMGWTGRTFQAESASDLLLTGYSVLLVLKDTCHFVPNYHHYHPVTLMTTGWMKSGASLCEVKENMRIQSNLYQALTNEQ